MITQHYKLKATEEHIREGRPGQFVFHGNDNDELAGFIDFVSDCELCIMLFQPTDMPDRPDMTVISETCDWKARLKEILSEDPEMFDLWKEVLTRSEKTS